MFKKTMKLYFLLFLSIFYLSCENDDLLNDSMLSDFSDSDIITLESTNSRLPYIKILKEEFDALIDFLEVLELTLDDLEVGPYYLTIDGIESYQYIRFDVNNYKITEIFIRGYGLSQDAFSNISNFSNIKNLEIREEYEITEITSDIVSNLDDLSLVVLDDLIDLVNIDGLKGHEKIQHLDIINCPELYFDSEFFYSFPNMVELDFYNLHNINVELNESISNFSNLQVLDLREVNINGTIPLELFMLDDITRIYIEDTNISGELPDIAGYHDDLTELDLSDNNLTGALPLSFYDFNENVYVDLSNNNLSGDILDLICDSYNPPELRDNNFCGYVPECYYTYQYCDEQVNYDNYYHINGNFYKKTDFDALQAIIDVSNFSEHDDEPLELCSWTHDYIGSDRFYYVYYCYFNNSGFVDIDGFSFNELAKLSSLEQLTIRSESDVTGPIPSSIGQLENLEILELSSLDDLIGTLPDEIGNLQKLKDLTLSYNYDMSGTLPSSIWTLSQLEDLEIEHLGLDLYVTLTSDIENLNNLVSLQFDNIIFSDGVIALPDELFNIDDLATLIIRNTNLEGELPASIGNLDDIQYIDLSNNNISGVLPESIINLSKLNYLDLSYNNISGLPTNMCDMQLDYIGCLEVELDYNNLCGVEEGCYCTGENSIWTDVCP